MLFPRLAEQTSLHVHIGHAASACQPSASYRVVAAIHQPVFPSPSCCPPTELSSATAISILIAVDLALKIRGRTKHIHGSSTRGPSWIFLHLVLCHASWVWHAEVTLRKTPFKDPRQSSWLREGLEYTLSPGPSWNRSLTQPRRG